MPNRKEIRRVLFCRICLPPFDRSRHRRRYRRRPRFNDCTLIKWEQVVLEATKRPTSASASASEKLVRTRIFCQSQRGHVTRSRPRPMTKWKIRFCFGLNIYRRIFFSDRIFPARHRIVERSECSRKFVIVMRPTVKIELSYYHDANTAALCYLIFTVNLLC